MIIAILAFLASWNNINHLPPWNGFYSEAFAVASLIFLLVYYISKGQKLSIGINFLVFFALFTAHALFLYLSKRIFFISSSVLYGYYALFLALVFHLGQIIQKEQHENVIIYVIFLTSFFSAFFALAEWLGLGQYGIFSWLIDSHRFSFKAFGNIMQPNHLGTFCIMGLGAVVIIWNRQNWHWISAIPSMAILSTVTALTASRAALLNIILIAGTTYLFTDKTKRKQTLILAALFVSFFAFANFFAKNFYETLLLGSTHGISLTDRGTNSAGRFALWAQAIQSIKLDPWLGFGWRQIPAAQISVAHHHPGIYPTIYYHNFFLDLLVENGIIFSFLYAAVFYYWIKKYRFNKNKDFFSIAAALIIPSLTEYQFAYTYLLFPAVLCLSIALKKEDSSQAQEAITKKYMHPQHIIISIFIVTSIIIFIDYIKCEKDFVSSRLRANGVSTELENTTSPKSFILDDLALLSNITSFDKQHYSSEELRKLKYLSARFPYIIIKEYYIRALVQFNEIDEARKLYKGVMNCYGENAKTHLNKVIESNRSLWSVRN